MSEEFFHDLENGTKKMSEFKGTITFKNISNENPCEETININHNPIIIPGGSAFVQNGSGFSYGGNGEDVLFFEEPDSNCWAYVLIPCCHNQSHY